MLSFFRRMINSKYGLIVTFAVLGIIALAFAAGDVSGIRSTGIASLGGDSVATIGGQKVTGADLKSRVNNAMEGARQQQPDLTIASFIQQNGVESVLGQLVNSIAFEEFAHQNGMLVSKRSVDGQIASLPGLQGPTGKFDPTIYQQLLQQRRLTDAQVRSDMARDTVGQQLIIPTIGATQIPVQLALPYASLLLEKRSGQIGFVPTAIAAGGPAPTDGELTNFYGRNLPRYTLPERRALRYAVVTPAMVAAKAVPTEAEIAAAYRKDAAKYAASEKRTVASVVVADQAGANAIAAKVKGGTPIADAARAAGLEAATTTGDKAALASASSPALADAVFAAAKGATVGPVRSPLGYTVAHLDGVTQVAGKTLAEATPEITKVLTAAKQQAALATVHDAMDDALSSNSTFDEILADQKLTAQTTPPVTAQGINPDTPDAKPDPMLSQVAAAGFQGVEGDAPQLVQVGTDGGFAIVAIGRVVPSAPRPFASVRDAVTKDVLAERARNAARTLASVILSRINKGMPLPQALATSGKPLPAARPLAASRAQLAANPRGAPPPLVLMFSMAQGAAKLLEAPENAGWYIIKLDRIDRGNATGNKQVVDAARGDLSRQVGTEYAQQFANAVRASLGSKTDDAAVARVKADLAGTGAPGN